MTTASKKKTGHPLGLTGALSRAQADADYIVKDKHNGFAKFDYASAEALMTMWTKISAKHNLVLYPRSQKVIVIEGRLFLEQNWLLQYPDSDQFMDIISHWPIVEAKGRPLDKAIASARTSSLSYMIRDILIAPRVNETDEMDHPKWSSMDNGQQATVKKWPGDYDDLLNRLHGDWTLNEIEVLATSHRRPHPVDMTDENRISLIEYCSSAKGQAALQNIRTGGAQ